MSDEYHICFQCCEDVDKVYVFRIKCLIAKTALIDYNVQVKTVNNMNIENFLQALNIKTEDTIANLISATTNNQSQVELKTESNPECELSVVIEEKIKTEDIKSELEDNILSGYSSGDDNQDGKNFECTYDLSIDVWYNFFFIILDGFDDVDEDPNFEVAKPIKNKRGKSFFISII